MEKIKRLMLGGVPFLALFIRCTEKSSSEVVGTVSSNQPTGIFGVPTKKLLSTYPGSADSVSVNEAGINEISQLFYAFLRVDTGFQSFVAQQKVPEEYTIDTLNIHNRLLTKWGIINGQMLVAGQGFTFASYEYPFVPIKEVRRVNTKDFESLSQLFTPEELTTINIYVPEQHSYIASGLTSCGFIFIDSSNYNREVVVVNELLHALFVQHNLRIKDPKSKNITIDGYTGDFNQFEEFCSNAVSLYTAFNEINDVDEMSQFKDDLFIYLLFQIQGREQELTKNHYYGVNQKFAFSIFKKYASQELLQEKKKLEGEYNQDLYNITNCNFDELLRLIDGLERGEYKKYIDMSLEKYSQGTTSLDDLKGAVSYYYLKDKVEARVEQPFWESLSENNRGAILNSQMRIAKKFMSRVRKYQTKHF